jgi:menaquinone-dependent protoporphyrinogen oxidase
MTTKPVLVLYATCEGHTRRIADRVSEALRARGFAPDVVNAAEVPGGFSLDAYSAALLTAPVRRGRHAKEMTAFVKRYRRQLENMPAAFLSVSLSQAGAQDPTAPVERRTQAAADVRMMIDAFLKETEWRPTSIYPVAGALLYRQYNFLLRFLMKQIARKAGGDTDTSRDYEYTDWNALDRVVEEFVAAIAASMPV